MARDPDRPRPSGRFPDFLSLESSAASRPACDAMNAAGGTLSAALHRDRPKPTDLGSRAANRCDQSMGPGLGMGWGSPGGLIGGPGSGVGIGSGPGGTGRGSSGGTVIVLLPLETILLPESARVHHLQQAKSPGVRRPLSGRVSGARKRTGKGDSLAWRRSAAARVRKTRPRKCPVTGGYTATP